MEPAGPAALGKSGVAEPIVGRAFLIVRQHIVGFAEFLEFLFGVRVVRIFVRMKLYRELAIGAFNLVARRLAIDAQDFVVIAFGSHVGMKLMLAIALRDVSSTSTSGSDCYADLPLETTTLEGRRSRSLSR